MESKQANGSTHTKPCTLNEPWWYVVWDDNFGGALQQTDNSIGCGSQEAFTGHLKTRHQTDDDSSSIKVMGARMQHRKLTNSYTHAND